MIEDRLYKFKNQYLIYSLAKKNSSKLAIIFSAVDTVPARNGMSYYSQALKMPTNVLHIMDNFGAHGNYLFSFINPSLQIAVIALINLVLNEIDVDLANVYFMGSSKGGFSAIYYSLALGGGTIIAGEPQIKLGDFLFRENWLVNEAVKAITYSICGRVSIEDKTKLNEILYSYPGNRVPFNGKVIIHYGEKTGYLNRHIKFLSEIIVSHGGSVKRGFKMGHFYPIFSNLFHTARSRIGPLKMYNYVIKNPLLMLF